MNLKIPIVILSFFVISCNEKKNQDNDLPISEDIRFNQIGYLLGGPKIFIIVNSSAEEFKLIDESGNIKFEGVLKDGGIWDSSGEEVKTGDFTKFNEPGFYKIIIPETAESYPFIIGANIFRDAAIDGLKSFYLQRMSMDIKQKYAGVYKRKAGHPDTVCYYHASSGKNSGTLASPGGWYDAGDYGKYIVNATVTVGTMLALYEIKPQIFQDGSLWIPESGNNKNDLLDEIKYELNWMLTMQDEDGGVFHKLTTKNFEGFVMPVDAVNDRYVIGKSTAAALDFAATMAMASRIYEEYDPVFSDNCLDVSLRAWEWAWSNPEEFYEHNPEDVVTGAYNDVILGEEFFWAAAEIYTTTGDENFYNQIKNQFTGMQFRIKESWRNYVDNIGYYSLVTPGSPLHDSDKGIIVDRMKVLSDSLSYIAENHPYRIPIDQFVWGSNSDYLNAGVLLLTTYHYTHDKKYLNTALETLDYIFGKNATGYSMVTGYGSKTSMHIHHRQSEADGIIDPFPGFVVGGPNNDREDEINLAEKDKKYESPYPARAYLDDVDSWASNEICINWNAPYVFMMGYLSDTSEE